jgi:hypothetical protein
MLCWLVILDGHKVMAEYNINVSLPFFSDAESSLILMEALNCNFCVKSQEQFEIEITHLHSATIWNLFSFY